MLWVFLWLSALPAAVLRFDRQAALLWQNRYLPLLRSALARLSGLFSFPLCDALFIALILALLASAIARRDLLPGIAALLSLSLSLTWAAPCALVQNAHAATAAELRRLCEDLSAEAASLRKNMRVLSREGISEYAADLCASPIVPKAALSPRLMQAIGLAGWWSPFTSEAVVDMSMGALNLPFALCHELMHAKGIADEAQAHLGAYQACMRGDPTFRYSGAINALWHAMRRLHEADADAWTQIRVNMDRNVHDDLARMHCFEDLSCGPIALLQDAATHVYLHLSGLQHYDAFADLLCREKTAQENACLYLTQ